MLQNHRIIFKIGIVELFHPNWYRADCDDTRYSTIFGSNGKFSSKSNQRALDFIANENHVESISSKWLLMFQSKWLLLKAVYFLGYQFLNGISSIPRKIATFHMKRLLSDISIVVHPGFSVFHCSVLVKIMIGWAEWNFESSVSNRVKCLIEWNVQSKSIPLISHSVFCEPMLSFS